MNDSIIIDLYLQNADSAVKKSDKLINARCNVCGDSQRSKRKKRQYLYYNNGHGKFEVKCHKCGYCKTFMTWLRTYFPDEASTFKRINFSDIDVNNAFKNMKRIPIKDKEKSTKPVSNLMNDFFRNDCFRVCLKQEDSFLETKRKTIIEYLVQRYIPPNHIKNLFYCHAPSSKWYDRIVVPFINGKYIYYFQGRAWRREVELRYLTAKFDDLKIKSATFGEFTVDKNETVYVCEGLFDAMNIRNAIAVCGCGFSDEEVNNLNTKFKDLVFVMDNDKVGKEKTKELLTNGNKCFIFPKRYSYSKGFKDINDICKYEKKVYIPESLLKGGVYQGKIGLVGFL